MMSLSPLFKAAVCLLLVSALPASADIVIDLGRGPVTVFVPTSYDPAVPTPLVVLLHGFGCDGAWVESYFQLLPLAEQHGFLYMCPEGTVDQDGNRFWNATDSCCDFYGTGVDDSAYLLALVDEVKTLLNVDPGKVFFAGHSNGAFMSYRMACDHSGTVAAIASLAGATYDDPLGCAPSSAVHVLQIHGTADSMILYEGGTGPLGPYPGAVQTIEQWAAFDGCVIDGVPTPPPLDLDSSIAGAETDVDVYDVGCSVDGSAQLWSINGGTHFPSLTDEFSPSVIDFLLSHPKTSPIFDDGFEFGDASRWSDSVGFP